MAYQILPQLNKDYIFSKLSQETIFKKYLQVDELYDNEKYKSPFDFNEEDPSFTLRYSSGGKLKGTDWGGTFRGDCFDLVAALHGLDIDKKGDFFKVLHIIAKDFKIHQYADGETILNYEILRSVRLLTKHNRLKIHITARQFNSSDITWIKLKIGLDKLKKFKVVAVKEVYLNDDLRPIYTYNPRDPAYAYYLSPNNTDIKIYYPNRNKGDKRKPRFLANCSIIQGLEQIQSSDIGIITKSYKDVIVLNRFKVDGKEIQSVAPNSETLLITPTQYEFLKTKYKRVYSLYDYDPAGLHMMWLLRKLYGIQPLFLKNPTWNKKIKYPIKDFADLVEHNSDETVYRILNETYEKLRQSSSTN